MYSKGDALYLIFPVIVMDMVIIMVIVMIYEMAWFNFFPKVSMKRPVPFQKKIDCTVLFTYLLTVSIKCPGLDI